MKLGLVGPLVIACALLITSAYAGKILCVTFVSGKSQKLTYLPLLEELGKRGHNVTILTPITPTKQMKNVNEILTIDWEELQKKIFENTKFNPFESKQTGKSMNPYLNLEWFTDMCRNSYDLPIIKEILKDEFDLIFFQSLFNDCALGLVHRLKSQMVMFSPVGVTGFMANRIGGHFPHSFTPNLFLGNPEEMAFYERFYSFGYNIIFEGILRFYYEPAMEAIYREKLGNDIPSIQEIISDQAALLLSNGHFTLHQPKPYFPDIVDIGGIHSRPGKALPKDLENFIQKGKNGFIYFSMGSGIKGSQMPEDKRKMFLNVFSKLEQQVLWKWETETMPDLPKNVKLSKWLPQQDLLGHKDIKLFITHCGGGSTEEAIYHGTPLLGFPMFGDQPLNAKLARDHGFIVELDWNTVTEEKLMRGIQEILNNPKYSENVKRLSILYKDQPDDPMQRAIYWVEYVMRHKGAPHLRSVGRKLNFFQYHSYDVILAYVGLICIVLYLTYGFIRFTIRKVCGISSKMELSGKPKRE